MASSVDFKWNTKNVELIQRKFQIGLVKMAYAVSNQAKHNAPYKTGALKNSIRVTDKSSATVSQGTSGVNELFVLAGGKVGGKSIAYARIHELGGYTGRNHSVYIAPKHYLANALNTVAAGGVGRFFKGVA